MIWLREVFLTDPPSPLPGPSLSVRSRLERGKFDLASQQEINNKGE